MNWALVAVAAVFAAGGPLALRAEEQPPAELPEPSAAALERSAAHAKTNPVTKSSWRWLARAALETRDSRPEKYDSVFNEAKQIVLDTGENKSKSPIACFLHGTLRAFVKTGSGRTEPQIEGKRNERHWMMNSNRMHACMQSVSETPQCSCPISVPTASSQPGG